MERAKTQAQPTAFPGTSVATAKAMRLPGMLTLSPLGAVGRTVRAVRALPSSLLIGGLVGAGVVWLAADRPGTTAKENPRPVMRTDVVSRIARDRERSVVLLHSISEPASTAEDPESGGWLLRPVREALGSGIVIDTNGLILTNAHVVRAAEHVHVRRPDGEDVNTTLVGTDRDSDLALVRVSDATGLVPAPLGDSDEIDVGSFVVAIGSPLGLQHTVTLGVLSGKARGLDNSGLEFLQTDAAVNPGNSGGPLLDLSGRVVGVITAILSGGGENVGLNFAIPINTVKEILPALRTNSVAHPWLGILTVGLSPRGAKALGLAQPADGLLITAVESTGPAARAGVAPFDILLGMGGDPRVRAVDVYRRIRTMAPGTTITLKVLREGKPMELPVVLSSRPAKD
jgi:serine protease Do